MTEIDLYVELLDDAEADKVLKKFRETVPGYSKKPARLEQKKAYIRLIFKRQTPSTRSNKTRKEDPFLFHIKSYQRDDLEELTESEFFYLLSTMNNDVPDHIKFAAAILYHPISVKEMLSEISDNIQGNKPLFGEKFLTVDNTKDFLKNIGVLSGGKQLESLIESLEDYLPNAKEELPSILPMIKPLGVLEFFTNLKEMQKEHSELLLQYSYALTHPDEDPDIRLSLLINVMSRIITSQKEEFVKASESFENEKKSLRENEIYIEQVRNLEEETLRYQERILEGVEGIRTLEDEKAELIGELVQHKENLQKVSDERDAFAANQKETEEKLEQVNELYNRTDLELKKSRSQIVDFSTDFDFAEDHNIPFAVIYSLETNIFELFYPEIVVIHISDWEHHKERILQRNIRHLYIQRNGISTMMYLDIEDFAKKYKLGSEMFLSRSPKELVESVGYFKKKQQYGGV